MALMELNAATF